MKPNTREAYRAYCETIAKLAETHVDDVMAGRKFTPTTPMEQTLESKIQESSAFLARVNSIPVTDTTGERLGMLASATIAGRTNTLTDDRPTQDPTGLDDVQYTVKQTNFDTHVKYSKLDLWARYADFQTRMRDKIIEQIGRDRLMIGFNGTSAATATNRATNPLLQDVNIGWLQKMRTEKAANVLDDGAHTTGAETEVRIGLRGSGTTDHDYLTLEGAVHDARHSLLDPWHRNSPDLHVLLSYDLFGEYSLPIVDGNGVPTEKEAVNRLMFLNGLHLAGLPIVVAPFFPDRTFAVLPLPPERAGATGDVGSVLSIYYQEGTRRRAIIDNPKRDQIEDFQSVNECYVIEDHGAIAIVENIIYPEEGSWET
jgi:P2 family phage major capsid protein